MISNTYKNPYKFNPSSNAGGILLISIVVIATVCIIITGMYLWGAKHQNQFDGYLTEGYSHIESDRPILALEAYQHAENRMSISLSFYQFVRRIMGDSFVEPAELYKLYISACIMGAYADFFNLKPASQLLEKAGSREHFLAGSDGTEIRGILETACEVSVLCELYSQKKFEEVMKKLLEVEKKAQKTDRDFYIQEIRLLIACGKAMNEPEIINHARELLWFFSYEVGIEDPRMNLLWGKLSE